MLFPPGRLVVCVQSTNIHSHVSQSTVSDLKAELSEKTKYAAEAIVDAGNKLGYKVGLTRDPNTQPLPHQDAKRTTTPAAVTTDPNNLS